MHIDTCIKLTLFTWVYRFKLQSTCYTPVLIEYSDIAIISLSSYLCVVLELVSNIKLCCFILTVCFDWLGYTMELSKMYLIISTWLIFHDTTGLKPASKSLFVIASTADLHVNNVSFEDYFESINDVYMSILC